MKKQIIWCGILALFSPLLYAETESVKADDMRLKHIQSPVENNQDLEKISQIEIHNFTMADYHRFGKDIHQGISAQQLEIIFADVIRKKTGFVPSVYALASDASVVGSETFITSPRPHQFKAGDKVKLITEDAGDITATVTKIVSEREFAIGDIINSKIFIHGKEVTDLREIDYQALAVRHLSATQALQKAIQWLVVKNKELIDINSELRERVDDIEKLLIKEPETEELE